MRVLVLSGGGCRGAYQCGIIKYLTEQGHSWDLIAGVSTGALNASFLSQYPPIMQVGGAQDLENVWRSIKGNKSIYKKWLEPILPSVLSYVMSFWTGGLFSTSPLKKLLRKSLNIKKILNSNVKLLIGAVSLTTGKSNFVREYDSQLFKWILASAAYPVAFQPVSINGDLWIDGGLKKDHSLLPLILNQQPVEIDIITTTPIEDKVLVAPNIKRSSLTVAVRTIQLLNEELFPKSFIENLKLSGIKTNIFAPKETLKVELLEFSPETIQKLLEKGYNDAKDQFGKQVNI